MFSNFFITAENGPLQVCQKLAKGLGKIRTIIEVTQALSTLALSRATDPKMKPVTELLQDPNWLNVDGGAAYGSYQGVAAQSGGVVGTLKSIRSTLMDQKQAMFVLTLS